MSFTAVCVTALILLMIGLVTSIDIKTILIVTGLLFATFLILHPWDIISIFHTRRKAVRKQKIAETGKSSLYKGRTPLASQLTELTPLIIDEKVKG